MRIALFYHSLLSDWNHGNAHFLRGYAGALMERGHEVRIYEPRDGWSLSHLRKDCGEGAIDEFRRVYPHLQSIPYDAASLDPDSELAGVDLIVVHEWNDPALVARLGEYRRRSDCRILFHDTHHRSVTAPEQMAAYDLRHYDGVLAFGRVVRDIYLERGWARQAWIWHEAADVRVFKPLPDEPCEYDLVWIGNWGDEERTAELREYLLEPVRELGLKALVHGVRYPRSALRELADAGIEYGGYLPNVDVPRLFARSRMTVHVPRRPYVEQLPGIPTIRVFEALACGTPLVCSAWEDREGLFRAGYDFLVARSGREMAMHLQSLRSRPTAAGELASHGVGVIHAHHTCGHRAEQLLKICGELGLNTGPTAESQPAA